MSATTRHRHPPSPANHEQWQAQQPQQSSRVEAIEHTRQSSPPSSSSSSSLFQTNDEDNDHGVRERKYKENKKRRSGKRATTTSGDDSHIPSDAVGVHDECGRLDGAGRHAEKTMSASINNLQSILTTCDVVAMETSMCGHDQSQQPISVSPSLNSVTYNHNHNNNNNDSQTPTTTNKDGLDNVQASPYSQYVDRSLCIFGRDTFPRNYCLRLICNPWFERVSMIAILLNCVTLGMYQPCVDDNCVTPRCKMLQKFDDIIFGFFAIEMTIKMLAMGIRGGNAYMSDYWNRLDFFIVFAGALEYCLDVGNMNLSAIRTVRVLRPLRAINRIPSMRILVMLLLDTLPAYNFGLVCFVNAVTWSCHRMFRCPMASYYQNEDGDKDYICSLDKDNGMHRCVNLPPSRYYHLTCTEPAQPYPASNLPNDTSCVNWSQYYTECRAGLNNPFQNAISFDNVGMAWTAIFLVISLEGWSDIMYYVQDAHSFWSWIYFVLLIVIGSFFMINLCLVVIATQFSETKKREMERMRQERTKERYHSQSTLASFSVSEQLNCYAALIQYLAHLIRKVNRRISKWYRNRRRQRRMHRHHSSKHHRSSNNTNARRRSTPNCQTCRACCPSCCSPGALPATSRQRFLASNLLLSDKQQQQQQSSPTKSNVLIARDANELMTSTIVTTSSDGNLLPKVCSPSSSLSASDNLVSSINPANTTTSSVGPSTLPAPDCQAIIYPAPLCSNPHPSRQSPPTSTVALPSHVPINVNEPNIINNKVFLKNARARQQQQQQQQARANGKKRNSLKTCDNHQTSEGLSPTTTTAVTCSSPSSIINTNVLLTMAKSRSRTSINFAVPEQAELETTSANRHSSPNLFAHYHHHHHHHQPHEERADLPGQALPCSLVTSLNDNNQPRNSIVRCPARSSSGRKLSQGTISWDSSLCVLNEPDSPQARGETRRRRRAKGSGSVTNDSCHMAHHCPHHQTGSYSHIQRNRSLAHSEHRHSCGSIFSGRSQTSRQTTSTISLYKRCCTHPNTRRLLHLGASMQRIMQKIVNHNYFQQAIFLAILLNTLAMGIEYHNQPESLSRAVEISNIIFAAIFGVEMLLKLIADGFYEYIKSGFNVFDGTIVLISMLELLEEQGSGGSGLSVLRTFRLLRILKLVRFMPALRRQLVIMLRTIDNVAVFFALLILFIFIFSILGMNLFGCKFCQKDPLDGMIECDRKNFDSLLWALVTVFQILTQEDWNVVLFNGMERTSPYAALYFVALMTFGNYVLFNLLVAILVEGFSQEDDKKDSLSNLEDNMEEVKQERLIYFYSPNDDLEREIQNLRKSELRTTSMGSIVKSSTCNSVVARASKAGLVEAKCVDDFPSISMTNVGNKANETQAAINNLSIDLLLPPLIIHTAATPQGSPPSSVLDSLSFYIDIDKHEHGQTAKVVDNSPHTSKFGSTSDWNALEDGHHATGNASLTRRLGNQDKCDANETQQSCMNSERPAEEEAQSSLMFPMRKEQSCREISSLQFDKTLPVTPVLSKQKSVDKASKGKGKQRRQSIFFLSKQASSSEKEEVDANCPIYASRNKVLRRKSIFEPSSSMSVEIDETLHRLSPAEEVNDVFVPSIITPSPPPPPPAIAIPTTIASDLVPFQASIDGRSLSAAAPPAVSLSPIYFTTTDRKNSLIHEIRVLSPRNSLSGIFYSSSIISVRNSSLNEESIQEDEEDDEEHKEEQIKEEESNQNKTGPTSLPAKLKNVTSDLVKIRKFCIWFKWTSWMTDRQDYSLFFFPKENRIRTFCLELADHSYFDYVVLIFISLNCITLAMERPKIPPWSKEREFLSVANYIFTFVFAVEMLIKVIAKGLFYGREAYFHNGWNIMDGLLVGISFFDIFLSFFAQKSPRIFGILRVFRLLRSLRPLRVINRAPGLKLVVQTLLSSLRPIGNIVLICCTFFIIFGILGVQLFKGAFFYCDGPKVKHVHNKTECLSDPRNTWVNRKYNFDNLGQALMSLFVLSSKDGWVNIMYTGLDAVGVDQQPIQNFNEWRLLYFISFLLLVAFFVLNMFVGVVVENFHRCRKEQEMEEMALRALKRAQKMEKRRKKMREPPYFIGYGRCRLFIHKIVTGKYFDVVIALVIGLNVITMSLEHYLMPMELVYTLKLFNFIFSSVFVVEAIMKGVALGLRRYLKDKWNQLDVMIVILSILGIILEEMESTLIPINPTIIRVMRVARIARVLKLLKMANGIRQLLDTVMQALPQVGNLGLLFFLLFFIFAALGTELFGRLECDEEHPCQGLGEHAHFQNFGMAFLTLFRVATGDNWNGIMKDTLRDKCDPSSDCLQNCCISPVVAPLYFVIFVLMAQFVLVNVVVAVLMKHLEESHKQLEEDEDHDIDMQIAKEIEAEKIALLEAMERRKRENELKVRRPLMKMASLPSNFTFTHPEASNHAKKETTTAAATLKPNDSTIDSKAQSKRRGKGKKKDEVPSSLSFYNQAELGNTLSTNNLKSDNILKKSHSLRARPSKPFQTDFTPPTKASLAVKETTNDCSSLESSSSQAKRASRPSSAVSSRQACKHKSFKSHHLSPEIPSIKINIEQCATGSEEGDDEEHHRMMSSTTAATPVTTTTSPSRGVIVSNGLKHRKLSDFLDEESAPLSPGVLVCYPEFSTDVITCEEAEDLNALEDDEVVENNREEMSLASAESWPSTELTTDTTTASNLPSDTSKQSTT